MKGFRLFCIMLCAGYLAFSPIGNASACGLPLPVAKEKKELLLSSISDKRYEAVHRSLFHATTASLHSFFIYLKDNLTEYPDLQKVADIAFSWDYLSPYIKQDPTLLRHVSPEVPDYNRLAALALKHDVEAISYISSQRLTDKALLNQLIRHVDSQDHDKKNATDWPVGSFLTFNQTYRSMRELYAPFYKALKAGNVTEMSDLIIQGELDPNLPTFSCDTPLAVAMAKNDERVATALIEHGATPRIETLMLAVNSDEKALFKLLLEATKQDGASVSTGRVLTEAVIQGNLELIKLLADEGADIKQRDNFGRTLLHEAAYHGHEDVVSYLISQGVNIAAIDRFTYNGTALKAAVSNADKENTKVVKQLIEAGFNPKKHVPEAILFATYHNHLDTVKVLLRAGVNIDTMVKTVSMSPYLENKTPLHIAIERDYVEIIDYLIEEGASETILDSKGRPPLQLAVIEQRPEIVKVFTKFDVNLNIRDAQGRTALHHALSSGYVDPVTLQQLLEYGARPAYFQGDGLGYVEGDLVESMQDIIKMLLEAGASVNEVDKQGKTPLDYVLREVDDSALPADPSSPAARNGAATNAPGEFVPNTGVQGLNY